MKLPRTLSLLTLAAVTACGGGGDDGTGPGANPNPNPNPTPTFASIRLTTNTFNLAAGQTATLTPEALDTNGSVIGNATGFTYSSSDDGVAEAEPEGTVIAIAAGDATITVSLTRDGVTATATASVTVTGTLPLTGAVVAGSAATVFTPDRIVVARNADVTFSFGVLLHNVTFESVAGAPADVPNTQNADVVRSFGTAGDFPYDCTLHAGMSGTVIVR
jgi:plastocyanin